MKYPPLGSVATLAVLLLIVPMDRGWADGGSGSSPTPDTGKAGYAEEKGEHPKIRKAIHLLHEAIEHMRKAPHDFGGHREAAVVASEAAIKQLKLALEYREGKTGAANGGSASGASSTPATVAPGGPGTPGYQEEKSAHPKLAHAIRELSHAIDYLKAAPHDFGGHREDAIKDSETAISQLQLALEYRETKESAHTTAAANK